MSNAPRVYGHVNGKRIERGHVTGQFPLGIWGNWYKVHPEVVPCKKDCYIAEACSHSTDL